MVGNPESKPGGKKYAVMLQYVCPHFHDGGPGRRKPGVGVAGE